MVGEKVTGGLLGDIYVGPRPKLLYRAGSSLKAETTVLVSKPDAELRTGISGVMLG